MKNGIYKKLMTLYFNIIRSISFIPVVITLFLAVMAFVSIWFDETSAAEDLVKAAPFLEMKSSRLASNIVTTLLAGTLSLTVFSFSMVMVVLNQAAMNFTPKILTQIVNDKNNQVALGFYLGTILYYIILLVNFTKDDDEILVPDISFFIAIILAVFSVILFVSFIHNISTSIQVKRVLQMIHRNTIEQLTKVKENETGINIIKIQEMTMQKPWFEYAAKQSGYLQQIMPSIADFLAQQDIILKMEVSLGEYVLCGNTIFSSNKELTPETSETISNYLIYYDEERVDTNAFYGFRQLTEIAIKALSPSINDPGTAVICINFITDLLARRMKMPDFECIVDDKDNIRLIILPITFNVILFTCFSNIRNYGKKDFTLLRRLLLDLGKLAQQDNKNKWQSALNEHALEIVKTAENNFTNQIDKIYFNHEILALNNMKNKYFQLPMLEVTDN